MSWATFMVFCMGFLFGVVTIVVVSCLVVASDADDRMEKYNETLK